MPTDKNQRQEEKAQMLECALPVKNTILTGKSGQKYKILAVLGTGGFGITYKAVSEVKVKEGFSAPMFFAIKEHFMKGCYRDTDKTHVLCPPTMRTDVEQSREDFRTEAERLMKLNGQSPNIVKVNEWFDANGTRYYVMEYLDGQTLDKYAAGRPLSEAKALSLLLPVARAVELVHQEKLLHLDIKPDNIVLKTDFASGATIPVLIDFGLAKHFDGKGRPTSHLVAKGATEGYAPMEQYGEIDHFAPEIDVYALGATLFYLLTGKNPPKAFEMEAVASLPCKLPPDVSPRVRQAVAGAMQPIKTSRTQTVAEFIAALESAEGASGKKEEKSGEKTVPFKHKKDDKAWFRKRPVVVGAACLLVCLLALCGRFLYVTVNSDEWKAKHGDVEAQIFLGEDYLSEGDTLNAIYWWTRAAEQGYDSGQEKLGDCYYKGVGVAQDYEKAVYWYTKAAEQGYPYAQKKLGDCYYKGEGVAQDYEKAVYWYTKAAEQDYSVAQFRLAECYALGLGVPQDDREAHEWWKKAKANGYAPYTLPREKNDNSGKGQ